ncbi:MAG: hypothetical protein R2806_10200 [Saprospiraceae bacterium]
MNRTDTRISVSGLAFGAVFGVLGSVFASHPLLQTGLYEISSVALVTAMVFLAIKFLRDDSDYLAAGFLVFAIGEAIMTVGMPLGQVGGQPSFGAGMAMYVPGLLFISIPKKFPLLVRLTGIAAAIPFGIAATKIFLGEQVLSTEPLPGAGYGLLTVTIIGWIWVLLRHK